MTDPEHDEFFEAYLKRRPVLPALDDKLEPPAALDQRVLMRAREAIKPQSGAGANAGASTGGQPAAAKPSTHRPPRWAVPVALAATILLCLSVVMNISLNTNRPSPNLERMTAARADVKASAEANAAAEADAQRGVQARSDSSDGSDGRAAAGNGVGSSSGEIRDSVAGDIPSHEVVLPGAKVAGSPARRAPVEAESATAADAATPSAPADTTLDATGGANRALTAAARQPALAQSRVSTQAAEEKAELFAKRAGMAPTEPAVAAPPALPPAAAPHSADPKAWLQQIAALRAAGQIPQADAEMRRFQAAFPGYAAKPAPAAAPDVPK